MTNFTDPILPDYQWDGKLESLLAATNWDEANREILRAKIVERVGDNPEIWDGEMSYPTPCPAFIPASLADEEAVELISVPATETDPKITLYATSALCWIETDQGYAHPFFRIFFWRKS